MKLACPILLLWAAAVQARPNFLFIFADDQRHDALSVVQAEQGERGRFPWLATPRMDRLAAEGLRFRNAFVVNSLCSPSRAVLLTGRYNHENGIASNFRDFPVNAVTHASLLRDAGYQTVYIGKWHMGNQRERPGFAEHYSYTGHSRYVDPVFIVNGKDTPRKGWIDDLSTDYAVDFIKRQKAGARPWSMTLGFKTPHGPFEPPSRTAKLYAGKLARSAPNLAAGAAYLPEQPKRAEKPPAEVPVNLDYFRCITAIDDCVGRALDALEETGQAASTVVIISSDNGFYLGEHGLGDKRSAYEESLRIPFIVRGPGVRPGVNDAMVLNLDLAPTLLELAGLPIPAAMRGRSLAGLMSGKTGEWRKSWLYEYFAENQKNSRVPDILAARTENAKLVNYPDRQAWNELYDLKADPYELNNLHGKPAAAGLQAALEAELAALRKDTGYQTPAWVDRPPGWGKTPGNAQPLPALRLEWKAENLAKDAVTDSGTLGNDGEVSGVRLAPGREGQLAMEFTGASRVSIGKQASLSPANTAWTAEVICRPTAGEGVILARGGATRGYALWLDDGRPAFTVNTGGKPATLRAETSLTGWATIAGRITAEKQALLIIDGKTVATAQLPSLIPQDPNDGMELGGDDGSPALPGAKPGFQGLVERARLLAE